MKKQMTNLEITLDNLQHVLDELPKFAEINPNIRKHFDMAIYGVYDDEVEGSIESKPEGWCGSGGCLLGSSALCFETLSQYYIGNFFSYYKFGRDAFPALYERYFGSNKWDFLFSDHWIEHQPTFEEALERIRIFIERKGELGEWKYAKDPFE